VQGCGGDILALGVPRVSLCGARDASPDDRGAERLRSGVSASVVYLNVVVRPLPARTTFGMKVAERHSGRGGAASHRGGGDDWVHRTGVRP
jgi:hypothetical protein